MPGNAQGRRMSSPPAPKQFVPGVSFDTFSNPSASDFSLTLNRKHRSYEYTKRSRTFLCGTDTNEYSDTALDYLLDELVDDGDEIVCLRVVEKDSKDAFRWSGGGQGEKGYRAEAERFIEGIERKNTDDRAISLVLEFSIGKVQDAIQQMIRIYEPAILVVGTKGRSLTGYGSLLSSGIRPSRKRAAKKRKREEDKTRGGYQDVLDKSEDAPRGRGGHLLDSRNRSSVIGEHLGLLGELESAGQQEDEARKVAEAIGYRQRRSHDNTTTTSAREGSLSRVVSGQFNRSADDLVSPHATDRVLASPPPTGLDSPSPSEDDGAPGAFDDDDGTTLADELPEPMRPEDEALMLAYERAQTVHEENKEEEEARFERERSRVKGGGRSRSRGAGGRGEVEQDEGGTGGAVLGLLAQLDRGIK
ncbi:hypothetical protein LTR56_016189 [Elasticomyces elasticus]|nr:hypothetical protein LTR56_016189 [Elasticomyces elasticus]KAK3642148.1 hypothetical protein LTR22_016269 [Elasticomyces elasticus]KAK4914196.1 hypothetical protein LTR49_017549 [Elasticomyces elasticus]KAK5762557.1 hypothetical protein LTS12_007348 [Elasticomyces elasticus]